mgnify:CR=1 FL=1
MDILNLSPADCKTDHQCDKSAEDSSLQICLLTCTQTSGSELAGSDWRHMVILSLLIALLANGLPVT